MVFPAILLLTTIFLFAFEPVYKQWTFAFMPEALANYFTKVNGSVFTIIPWFGYTAFGAFSSVMFTKFKDYRHIYTVAIGICAAVGLSLIYYSSPLFMALAGITGWGLFEAIYANNYLFIRLGDVFVVFAVFMLLRHLLTGKTILKIGQNTLSIYVIHFIVLYGSFTGLGLYRFLHHSLSPAVVIPGALAFMFICSFTALWYERHEEEIKLRVGLVFTKLYRYLEPNMVYVRRNSRIFIYRLVRLITAYVKQ